MYMITCTHTRIHTHNHTLQYKPRSRVVLQWRGGIYVRLIFGNTQGSGPTFIISEVSFNSTVGEFLCNSLCYISDSKLASTTWFTAVLTCSLSACVLVPVISFIFTQPTEHWPDRRSNCCNCCTDNWSHHCHHCFLLPLEEETVRVSHVKSVFVHGTLIIFWLNFPN